MTLAGAETVLYAFAGGTDGATPYGSLIQATDGNFYGTTYYGGASGIGAVFELALAPAITAPPQSQTIALGTTATVSVGASGTAPLTFQWYVGTTGTTTNPIAGATSSSYTTPALASTTSYWVQVSNPFATADSTTATITIGIAPAITTEPQTQIIVSGTTATISVGASGTVPLAYQWYVGVTGTTTSPIGGATSSGYTTPALTSTTPYWVRVSNPYGKADSTTATIVIGRAPTISTQPLSQTIASGTTATVSVGASGRPPLTYQWYVGLTGTTTSPVGANSSSYTTPALTGATSYWVKVSNPFGAVDSTTATIGIGIAPAITTQPQGQTIASGTTALMNVGASGTATLTYQWYVGTTGTTTGPVAGATSSSYTTPALTSTTCYWVQATNSFGTANSTTATIAIGIAPAITTPPQSQTIASGTPATVSVGASGTATLAYQWYVGPAGTTTSPVGGATSSSYTTPALTSTTSYWVKVSNPFGTANSTTATIAIGIAPAITAQPQSQTIASGTTATVSVGASGTTLIYQWYVGTTGTTTNPVGAASSSYTTPALAATTSYWVQVSNALGTVASATATVAVGTKQHADTIYSFAGGTDGANPDGSLLQATDGNFYGTTANGGVSGNGTVFKLTPAGTETVLYAFAGGTDGANPEGSVIQAADGNLYGTTSGGASGNGTVFKVTLAGVETVLYAFAGGTDGAYPFGSLIQANDGNLYGATAGGGFSNDGTVFKMTLAGTKIVLHAFTGGTDGANPQGSLVQSPDGSLYGTTASGGASSDGTVFKVTPGGTETVLYAFAGGTDGANPGGSLLLVGNNLYGTTPSGGASDDGTVFNVTLAGTETVLYAFAGGTDGSSPYGSLLQANDGTLYGTTAGGGTSSAGTVFELTLTGAETVVYAFTGAGTDGANPEGSLLQAIDGSLYATTYSGGASGNGVVFKLSPAAATGVAPAITTQPQSKTLASGTTATVSVTASGTGALTYQWFVGTTGATTSPIAGATSSTFATPALAGRTSYWVRVSDTFGTADSITATITGTAPPTFTMQPANRTVRAGQDPWFTAVASGTAAPTYQWQILANGEVAWSNLSGAWPYSGVTTGTLTVSSATVALNGTRYRCVATNSSGSATSSAAVLRIVTSIAPGDFDGDGKSDLNVYRSSSGGWYDLLSGSNYATSSLYLWGASTDIPVAGDYDGDGKADPAVYRPSTGQWFILTSSSNYTASIVLAWGVSTDVPVVGDYDGDGKADPAVYRPSTGQWFILTSSSNYTASIVFAWGVSTDIPVGGDYDGDGRADLTVYRPSTGQWFTLTSSSNYTAAIVQSWGVSTDVPLQGDYDGDGKADLAVYRPSTGQWFILTSSSNYTASIVQNWGVSTDVPLQGDYDGDGKADLAVYRPSTGQWFILTSSSNYTASIMQTWGDSTDTAIRQQP